MPDSTARGQLGAARHTFCALDGDEPHDSEVNPMHGAAAHAAMVNALRATGVIVRVRPEDLITILRRVEDPVVVTAHGGVFKKRYQYLTSYKGLAFYAESPTPLMLWRQVETVLAEKIWIPG